MKKFTFKGVLDGFRQQVQPQMTKPEQEIQETLRSEHFQLRKVSSTLSLYTLSVYSFLFPFSFSFSVHFIYSFLFRLFTTFIHVNYLRGRIGLVNQVESAVGGVFTYYIHNDI